MAKFPGSLHAVDLFKKKSGHSDSFPQLNSAYADIIKLSYTVEKNYNFEKHIRWIRGLYPYRWRSAAARADLLLFNQRLKTNRITCGFDSALVHWSQTTVLATDIFVYHDNNNLILSHFGFADEENSAFVAELPERNYDLYTILSVLKSHSPLQLFGWRIPLSALCRSLFHLHDSNNNTDTKSAGIPCNQRSLCLHSLQKKITCNTLKMWSMKKNGVVLQESNRQPLLCWRWRLRTLYPSISGVARSLNFYLRKMKTLWRRGQYCFRTVNHRGSGASKFSLHIIPKKIIQLSSWDGLQYHSEPFYAIDMYQLPPDHRWSL